MLEFILKYWIQFGLGLIVAGGTWLVKRYIKLEKESRAAEQAEAQEQIIKAIRAENLEMKQEIMAKYDEINDKVEKRYVEITTAVSNAMVAGRAESKADDAQLENEISSVQNEMDCLKAGMLSMQGREFRENCRKLLEEGHVITLDEWEELDADHVAYNGLGGNHRGDHLFSLVKKKVENTLLK